MGSIADDLDGSGQPTVPPIEHPNIIMVQLESFFDVNRLKDISFSTNPVPHFSELRETAVSGLLTVPVIGAGTVNTEFEVISGMSIEFFGTGEYPYKTVLRDTVSPSICYDLEKNGYTSHAIHNNTGTFYGRDEVYPNLGFDTFTSMEYMDNLRVNQLGWVKDSVLTGEILDALDSTSGCDFVYTVSVQPHGRYPDSGEFDMPIMASGLEDVGRQVQFQYYASQIYETDNFVDSLIKALDARGEPYIVVFFGDHLPSLSIENEELSEGTILQTEYVICTNTDYHTESEDICAYQLSAKVLEMAGLPGGVVAALHQSRSEYESNEEYLQKLELLEYDLLYGDREVLGGEMPYARKDMKMGVKEIKIVSCKLTEEGLYVKGENLTDASRIYVNGEELDDTVRAERDVLFAPEAEIEPGDQISIGQQASNGQVLSFSKSVTYKQ